MGFIVTHFNTKRNGIGKYEFIQVSRETPKCYIESFMFFFMNSGVFQIQYTNFYNIACPFKYSILLADNYPHSWFKIIL